MFPRPSKIYFSNNEKKSPMGWTCNFFFRLNKMFKILMCNCNRYLRDQLIVCYTYSFTIDDCNCPSDHERLALICERNISQHNLAGFARNYCSSVCCSCPDIDNGTVCIHCRRLRHWLNNDTIKVCLRK